MKKEYLKPIVKTLSLVEDEIMALSALDKGKGAQDVIPDDEEYDGEFGVNEAVWGEVDNFIVY